jgi:hypothetical protein
VNDRCRLLSGSSRRFAEFRIHAFKRYQDHRRYLGLERAYVRGVLARPGAAGALAPEFAARIAASAGLSNRIAHAYEDIDPARVHAALATALRDVPEYLRRMAAHAGVGGVRARVPSACHL